MSRGGDGSNMVSFCFTISENPEYLNRVIHLMTVAFTGGGVPQQLHEVDVPIINNTECQQMFLKSGHIKAIRDSFICAGYAQGLKDSCEVSMNAPKHFSLIS